MANDYQIDDLEHAVQALEEAVPDLEIDLNWAGEVNGTTKSDRVPMVWFYLEYAAVDPVEETHPATTVASRLAEVVVDAIGHKLAKKHEELIEAIRTAPSR